MYMTTNSNQYSGSYDKLLKSGTLRAIDVPYGWLVKAAADDPYWRRAGADERSSITVFVEMDPGERFYWHFGKEMLRGSVRSSKENPDTSGITWSQLHSFVSNYAWHEPSWRVLPNTPCWPLHPDVTEKVVSLFYGVRWHELHRVEESPAQITSFYHMTKTLAADVKESLSSCKLNSAKYKNTDESYTYVSHNPDLETMRWGWTLLHQVLEFEGGLLPPSPVMNTSFYVDRFDEWDDSEDS